MLFQTSVHLQNTNTIFDEFEYNTNFLIEYEIKELSDPP